MMICFLESFNFYLNHGSIAYLLDPSYIFSYSEHLFSSLKKIIIISASEDSLDRQFNEKMYVNSRHSSGILNISYS